MGKEITLEANVESIASVTAFVEEYLEPYGGSIKAVTQISVALDELVSNIVNYSGSKDYTVRIEVSDSKVTTLTFIDSGVPYNPLEKDDPDVTLSAEERKIGGLGIYMVKKTMDEMTYTYGDGQNILRIVKNILVKMTHLS